MFSDRQYYRHNDQRDSKRRYYDEGNYGNEEGEQEVKINDLLTKSLMAKTDEKPKLNKFESFNGSHTELSKGALEFLKSKEEEEYQNKRKVFEAEAKERHVGVPVTPESRLPYSWMMYESHKLKESDYATQEDYLKERNKYLHPVVGALQGQSIKSVDSKDEKKQKSKTSSTSNKKQPKRNTNNNKNKKNKKFDENDDDIIIDDNKLDDEINDNELESDDKKKKKKSEYVAPKNPKKFPLKDGTPAGKRKRLAQEDEMLQEQDIEEYKDSVEYKQYLKILDERSKTMAHSTKVIDPGLDYDGEIYTFKDPTSKNGEGGAFSAVSMRDAEMRKLWPSLRNMIERDLSQDPWEFAPEFVKNTYYTSHYQTAMKEMVGYLERLRHGDDGDSEEDEDGVDSENARMYFTSGTIQSKQKRIEEADGRKKRIQRMSFDVITEKLSSLKFFHFKTETKDGLDVTQAFSHDKIANKSFVAYYQSINFNFFILALVFIPNTDSQIGGQRIRLMLNSFEPPSIKKSRVYHTYKTFLLLSSASERKKS